MASTESSSYYQQDLETLAYVCLTHTTLFWQIFIMSFLLEYIQYLLQQTILDGVSEHALVSLKNCEKGTASHANGQWF